MFCAALLFVGFGCQRDSQPQANSTEIDRDQILSEARKSGLIMNENEVIQMTDLASGQTFDGTNPSNVAVYLKKDVKGWATAALADVTGGGSFGLAFTDHQNGKTILIAKMGNLPVLEEGSSYEGWLVRRGEEMGVVRVGKALATEDQSVIVFESSADLSDHDFFVLTRDSIHILEGSFR